MSAPYVCFVVTFLVLVVAGAYWATWYDKKHNVAED